jgi:hypothetical protein
VKGASEVRLAGLAAVRITWIAAIAGCALAIVSGLLFGASGGDSSRQLPGFAFADGGDSPQLLPEFVLPEPAAVVAGEAQVKTQKNTSAAPQRETSQWAEERGSGDGQARGEDPNRSGNQRKDVGVGAPVGTPAPKEPNPPRAPSVTPPKLPQSPSVTVETRQPAPSVTVETRPPAPSGDPAPSQPPVKVSASETGVSAQVRTPVADADVSVGL